MTDLNTHLTLEQAINLLKKIVKRSEALDEANHFDFSLVPASELSLYQLALRVAQGSLRRKEISQEEFEKKTHLKN